MSMKKNLKYLLLLSLLSFMACNGDEKIDFRLLTNSDEVGIEELVVLDKELHELFNGREVNISVQSFSKSDCPYDYYYYINYDEFVNKVQKLRDWRHRR